MKRYFRKLSGLACLTAAALCFPTTALAQGTNDIDGWYTDGQDALESGVGDGEGISPGSALVLGNPVLNNVDSGALLFDEDANNAPSCGFAFHYDGAVNILSLLTGCDGIPHTNQAMTFTRTTGRMGLGRVSATNTLEVEGNASKTMAGSWLANSDRSIKTDVREIANALAVVEQLRPVEFHYSDAFRALHPSIQEHRYANFIAQEFQEVFPDSVLAGGDGLLQVDSYVVRPYLVAAVQELSSTVKALREQNEELRERLDALERRLPERRRDPQP